MDYKHKYKKYKHKYTNLKDNKQITLSVRDPWLTYIEKGIKTVEGRTGNEEKFKNWIGKEVIFFNSKKKILVKVLDVHHYKTLYEYLDNEGFKNVLPGIPSYQEAVDIYHQFYDDEKIKNAGGMCGIVVKVIKTNI